MAENKGKKPAGQNAGKNKSAAACKRTVQGTKAARTAPPPKTPAAERQGIIKRLIETLKRVIGHKKGERDEVRYNNKERHKNWVFKEEGENVSALGLTHSGETFGGKNMPLKENPDKKDKTPAYIRHGVIRGKKSSFSTKPKKNLKFSKADKTNMKSKRRYHEKERKRQAAKKKEKQQKSK